MNLTSTKQVVPETRVDFSSGRPRYLTINRPLAPASTRAAVHAEIRTLNTLAAAIQAGDWRTVHRLLPQAARFAA